jgi:flagellin
VHAQVPPTSWGGTLERSGVVMEIGTNMAAQQSARLLSQSSARLSQSLARLASGSKIVSPADDPAGLAVATRFDARVHRLSAAETGVNNAISFIQTQDGYLQQICNSLDRMAELAVLARDVTKTDADRVLYDTEFKSIRSSLNAILHKQYNGKSLFAHQQDTEFVADSDCYVGATLSVQADGEGKTFTAEARAYVGHRGSGYVDNSALVFYSVTHGAVSVSHDSNFVPNQYDSWDTNVASASQAMAALSDVKTVISMMGNLRAQVGASLTRLNYTSEELATLRENLTAATSRIKDVDVADESTRFAQNQILVQAGTAMLAQANASPESVLRLLA